MKNLLRYSFLLLAILVLTACGGGGGDASSSSVFGASDSSSDSSSDSGGLGSFVLDEEVIKNDPEITGVPDWARSYFVTDDSVPEETEEERLARISSEIDELFTGRADEVKLHTIVMLNPESRFVPEGFLSGDDKLEQRDIIRRSQEQVLTAVRSKSVDFSSKTVSTFTTVPAMALEMTKEEALIMAQQPNVNAIYEDVLSAPDMAESNPLIGSSTAWTAGYSGSGQTVAVLDTGVAKTHAFLSGKVVSEACYSNAGGAGSGISFCPGGVTSSTASGSGVNCSTTLSGCDHGTHVAGTIAGNNGTIFGVAKDAKLIAIQVFTNIGGQVLSYTSDQIKALERVYALRSTYSISSVNMSLGGGRYYSACDSDATKTIIDNLKSVGIATVIASGNNGYGDSISAPGCISSAVTVGSVGDGSNGAVADVVSSFSNSASMIDLLAPGQYINSSVPGGGYSIKQGTSMATPHVAGAFAVMKSVNTSATVDDIENALKASGKSVTDTKNSLVKPRIRLNLAITSMGKGTVSIDISPVNAVADGAKWKMDAGDWQDSGATLTDVQVGNHTISFKSITNSDTTKIWRSPAQITVNVASDGDDVTDDGTYTETDKPAATKDINGDGSSDILIRNLTNGRLVYQIYNSFTISSTDNLKYMTGTVASASMSLYDMKAVADSNADGKADVLYRKKADGSYLLWTLNGNTITGADMVKTAAGTIITTASTTPLAAYADVNGDGKADIIRRDSSTGQVLIWLMNGSTFVSSAVAKDSLGNIVTHPVSTYSIVGAGDANGDGKADILYRNIKDGSYVLWFMNGTTITSRSTVKNTSGAVVKAGITAWMYAGFADMDSDGKADILLRNISTGAFYVFKLDAYVLSESKYLLDINGVSNIALKVSDWKMSDLIDMDGNGMSDIVLRNAVSGSYFCYQINYPGTKARGYLKAANGTTPTYSWSSWLSGY